jgi:hypothetical protein
MSQTQTKPKSNFAVEQAKVLEQFKTGSFGFV